MYITLKSIKRNLGLFNLEFEDLIIGGIFILVFVVLFLLKIYTIAIVVISLGVLSLVPMDFSKCNRMYKLFLLFVKYLFNDKHYYFYK
ncbi:MAG TPA: hypothetical protein DCE23_03615 [Firmicutes bacterium]|nr:hypothetical protein [Bacillota bacterium]